MPILIWFRRKRDIIPSTSTSTMSPNIMDMDITRSTIIPKLIMTMAIRDIMRPIIRFTTADIMVSLHKSFALTISIFSNSREDTMDGVMPDGDHHGHKKQAGWGDHGNHAGHHADHGYGHGHGLWTRNRGYGYEKHYAWDKELATNKHGHGHGSHGGHHGNHATYGHHGAAGHGGYGHHKHGHGAHHDEHHGGKYGHLLGHYGDHGHGYHAYPHHGGHGYGNHDGYHASNPVVAVAPIDHQPQVIHAPLQSSIHAAPLQVAPVGPYVGIHYQRRRR